MFLVVLTLTVIFIDLDLARMATAYPIEAGNEDNYELELSRVRGNIKTKFVELIDCLKARESELLRELDNILASYLSYRSELEKARNKVESLNVMKQQQEEAIMSSPVKPFIERLLNEINAELNPCLHLFNYNHIVQKNVISRCKGMEVIYPSFFFVDQTENILISDFSSNFIHIFITEFQLIHKIPVSNPTGVAVDKQGRVIVVCLADKDCLQIF